MRHKLFDHTPKPLMKIIALEVEAPGLSAADFQPHLQAEALHAWQMHQAGVIRELYFRADQHSAVLVLECASVEAAQQALADLPLVKAGLIHFDLIPLVAYPGFARLFATQEAGDQEIGDHAIADRATA